MASRHLRWSCIIYHLLVCVLDVVVMNNLFSTQEYNCIIYWLFRHRSVILRCMVYDNNIAINSLCNQHKFISYLITRKYLTLYRRQILMNFNALYYIQPKIYQIDLRCSSVTSNSSICLNSLIIATIGEIPSPVVRGSTIVIYEEICNSALLTRDFS